MTDSTIVRSVTVEQAGATLASIVRGLLTEIPWSKARELCRTGRVEIDGEPVFDDAQRVAPGMEIRVHPTGRKRGAFELGRDALLHVDDDVIVVRKPAAMLTCPFDDGDRGTLVDRVRTLLARKANRDPMVGVVQRLDKDTTGVLVFARNMKAKRHLEEQLRVHSVLRRYLAIVHGALTHPVRYETWLIQNRGDGLRGSWRGQAAPPAHAKRSVTHVRPIESLKSATMIECRLETGRQHQIRIHLSEAGHALVGEPVYIREHRGERLNAPRPMLHATTLGFVHPRTEETLRFDDPPPADFEQCLIALRA